MTVRFQADADLNEDIVTGLLRREPTVDFQTAPNAGLRGLTDQEVLELATSQSRIVVSHDRKTMPRHFGEFVQKKQSPGLIIVSQKADVLTVIDDLLLIGQAPRNESG